MTFTCVSFSSLVPCVYIYPSVFSCVCQFSFMHRVDFVPVIILVFSWVFKFNKDLFLSSTLSSCTATTIMWQWHSVLIVLFGCLFCFVLFIYLFIYLFIHLCLYDVIHFLYYVLGCVCCCVVIVLKLKLFKKNHFYIWI